MGRWKSSSSLGIYQENDRAETKKSMAIKTAGPGEEKRVVGRTAVTAGAGALVTEDIKY